MNTELGMLGASGIVKRIPISAGRLLANGGKPWLSFFSDGAPIWVFMKPRIWLQYFHFR